MPAKNNLISKYQASDAELVTITNIKDSTFEKAWEKNGKSGVIKFPYSVTIARGDGKKKSAPDVAFDDSQATLIPDNWETSMFYPEFKDNELTGRFKASRGKMLAAIVAILGSKHESALQKCYETEEGKFDVNMLEGVSFEAVIVDTDGFDPFIDWIATFRHNEVAVPSNQDNSKMVEKALGTTDTKSTVASTDEVDTDLPF